MNCFGSHRLEEVEAARAGNISGFVVLHDLYIQAEKEQTVKRIGPSTSVGFM